MEVKGRRRSAVSSSPSWPSREAIKPRQARSDVSVLGICRYKLSAKRSTGKQLRCSVLPKFARVDAPREGEKNYDEKRKSSIVYKFERVQKEEGRQTCSSSVAREWLHQHRPKTTLHPSMTDYCDTCKYLREQLSRQRAILNRLQQSGSVLETEVKTTEKTKTGVKAAQNHSYQSS